jgi:hypothetical protein
VNDPDLNPPALLADHLHVLREILGVHASTLADGAPAAEEAAAFARVLAAGVDPALEACAAAAAQKARAAPGWDARVFRLNCLAAVGAVLGEHEFAGEKSREVEEKVEEQVKELIEEHVSWLGLEGRRDSTDAHTSTWTSCTTRASQSPSLSSTASLRCVLTRVT